MDENEKPPFPKGRIGRFLHFPLVRIIIALLFVAIAYFAAAQGLGRLIIYASDALSLKRGDGALLLYTAFTILAAHLSYLGYVRLVEARAAVEFATNRALQDFGAGVLVGVALGGLVFGLLWLAGSLQVMGFNSWDVLVPALISALSAGYLEELLFRGILFRIVEEALGTLLALVLSALLFGLVHLKNPDATLTGACAIALTGGIVLGEAYALARTLWLPIGLHVTWNFIQEGVFGSPVSGKPATKGLLLSQLTGDPLLTGGAFGTEASLVGVLVALVLAGCLLAELRRKRRIVLPFWRR